MEPYEEKRVVQNGTPYTEKIMPFAYFSSLMNPLDPPTMNDVHTYNKDHGLITKNIYHSDGKVYSIKYSQ